MTVTYIDTDGQSTRLDIGSIVITVSDDVYVRSMNVNDNCRDEDSSSVHLQPPCFCHR